MTPEEIAYMRRILLGQYEEELARLRVCADRLSKWERSCAGTPQQRAALAVLRSTVADLEHLDAHGGLWAGEGE